MISYSEALKRLLHCAPLPTTSLPIQQACGFVTADRITSPQSVPPFTNSSMDGFAIRSEELATATPNAPVILTIVGSTAAGESPANAKGGTWEIMTGAALPQGYDAVVKIEDVECVGDRVRFTAPIGKGENVRLAGQDFNLGDVVVSPGDIIGPAQIMALAAVGQKNVTVHRKPSITLLNTGKELVQNTDIPLKPGQIRDASGPYLMTMLEALRYGANYGGLVPDDDKLFRARLEDILAEGAADVVISTGAVSAGKFDFIPDILRTLGAEIVFHKVTNRPGKPVLYARFANGIHYLGLPGNPVSTAVGSRFFALPLFRHLQALPEEKPLMARLLTQTRKVQGLRFFCKAHASVSEDQSLQVEVFDGQESFRIKPMLQANCWAVFDEDRSEIAPGETVAIYPLMPDRWMLRPLYA
ncbi:molybdopterin molybdotransferase [Cohaesibacter marisflavi]|uniref:Molybdopterin molybdenumtransferase n=1 Tax=Cohaesibacter marisflavi TaxID=655353 RepID=A0A1I5LU19_9HYPH|nr:gephyrin-like molybdotransferase Glp [Cohaesibacter marisflavi]SFP00770.1 molybdopterin molybdotransferase [Cohaesibacter marisflavi]